MDFPIPSQLVLPGGALSPMLGKCWEFRKEQEGTKCCFFSMLLLLTKNEQLLWGCAALMTKRLNWPLTFSPKRSEEKHYLEDI